MDTSSDIELKNAPIEERAHVLEGPGMPRRLRQAGEDAVLWLHHQADRMDLIPTEFGQDAEVDDSDAASLLREWIRQAKLWAAYNPEEMLALKAGAVALGGALLVLIFIIGAIR